MWPTSSFPYFFWHGWSITDFLTSMLMPEIAKLKRKFREYQEEEWVYSKVSSSKCHYFGKQNKTIGYHFPTTCAILSLVVWVFCWLFLILCKIKWVLMTGSVAWISFLEERYGSHDHMTFMWSQVGFLLAQTICSWKEHFERASLPKGNSLVASCKGFEISEG